MEVAAGGLGPELLPAPEPDEVVPAVAEEVQVRGEVQTFRLVRRLGARAHAVLQVSPRTVENHKRRLYAKLGVRSASHAVSRAVSLGVVDPVPTAPSRASFEAKRMVLTSVVTPPVSLSSSVMCAGSFDGMAPPTSPGS